MDLCSDLIHNITSHGNAPLIVNLSFLLIIIMKRMEYRIIQKKLCVQIHTEYTFRKLYYQW